MNKRLLATAFLISSVFLTAGCTGIPPLSVQAETTADKGVLYHYNRILEHMETITFDDNEPVTAEEILGDGVAVNQVVLTDEEQKTVANELSLTTVYRLVDGEKETVIDFYAYRAARVNAGIDFAVAQHYTCGTIVLDKERKDSVIKDAKCPEWLPAVRQQNNNDPRDKTLQEKPLLQLIAEYPVLTEHMFDATIIV